MLIFLIPIHLLAQSKSVLFIGNSYTGVNNLPVMTKNLALSLGDTLTIDANTPGGTTLNSHTNNSTSLTKIGQGIWDFVILQAQSQEPSFPPSQVASQTYPYAATLVDSILSANECTVPLFYMTWGRKNGDVSNCASYPVICTYEGMQSRLRESYLEMAVDNNAEVSPVGAAWKYVRDNHPTIELYSADESHPSAAGSYLAACVHYASIYKKSPIGASYSFSLNTTDAATLQNAAKLIVIDSLSNWNFGVANVTSNFTYINTTGMEYSFNNLSINGLQYEWNFGDGNTSSVETPSHNYTASGTYQVTLISSNNCTVDTVSSTITVFSNGLNNDFQSSFSVTDYPANWEINSSTQKELNITLYSLQGKIIYTLTSSSNSVQLEKPTTKGFYLLSVSNANASEKWIKRMVVQ